MSNTATAHAPIRCHSCGQFIPRGQEVAMRITKHEWSDFCPTCAGLRAKGLEFASNRRNHD